VKELQPRLLSLAINHGQSGTHQLFVKGEKNAQGEADLNPVTFDPTVADLRAELDKATRDPRNKNKPRTYKPIARGEPVPPEVAQIVRSLARKGNALHFSLFSSFSEDEDMRKALHNLRVTSDGRLQVVRFNPGSVFPWTLLYDFDIPDNKEDAPVCLGYAGDDSGNFNPCQHVHNSGVYCVRGFWGVRHQVEEFLKKLAPDSPISRPSGVPPVRILADGTIGSYETLKTDLAAALGRDAIACGPINDREIVELLWKEPPERPAVLIVLGHMEESDERIRLMDSNRMAEGFFSRATIAQRAITPAPWGQPRSIVMLMACESAATSLQTVNNFVNALRTAGASAIIGTECIIDSGFAASFAHSVTVALFKENKTLGQAITAFRRESLEKGLPLAFAFNAIGNVDLKIT
jgi:hypothetical protein